MEKNLTESIAKLTISRKCACGTDISKLPKNYKRCDTCRIKRLCNTCEKPIRPNNRSGYCKDCHLSMKIANDKHCAKCDKLLSVKNKSGYCKKCTFSSRKQLVSTAPSVTQTPEGTTERSTPKEPPKSINNNITRFCDKCNKPFDSIATDIHKRTCNNCTVFTEKQGKNTQRKLAKQGYSKVAIAWLNSIMNKEGINIQHALNGGEHKEQIGKYEFSFDGYCKETNTVYEFYGDRYHGNLQVYKPDDVLVDGKTARELYNKTLWREKQIVDAGYNLVVIWESQYNKK